MSATQKPINYTALDAMAAHWLEEIGGECMGHPSHAGDIAVTLLPLDTTYSEFLAAWKPGFDAGIEFGMRVASAIIQDALGDPRAELEDAVETARERLETDIMWMTAEWERSGYPKPPTPKEPITKRREGRVASTAPAKQTRKAAA